MSSNTLLGNDTPRTALVISCTYDDPKRVLTAVRYASLGNRKIVLAQVTLPPQSGISNGSSRRRRTVRPALRIDAAMERSEWLTIWSEILNRVFLLGSIHIEDIPEVAHAVGAHQLLLSSSQLAEEFWQLSCGYETGSIFDAPVWVLGRGVATVVPERIRRVLLPLSLRTGFETRLRTAAQLASASGATLAILHVISRRETELRETSTPWAVNARLQQFFNHLCDAPCPLEISIRDGNPAEAILKFDEQHRHDLVIVTSAEDLGAARHFYGATRWILNDAHCPVLLMRPEPAEKQRTVDLPIHEMSPSNLMFPHTSGVVQ